MKVNILVFSLMIFLSFFRILIAHGQENHVSKQIKIEWTENQEGDFSFTENWSYPEGIYRNQFGQLSCDGFCPEGIDSLKNDNGKIPEEKLVAFYQILDTIHLTHSIHSEAWCYEFSGTNFIHHSNSLEEKMIWETRINTATHCFLRLQIEGDKCIPFVVLNSIAHPKQQVFYCKKGKIQIDKTLWKKGIFKAIFNFTFQNHIEPQKDIFWKGRILSEFKR